MVKACCLSLLYLSKQSQSEHESFLTTATTSDIALHSFKLFPKHLSSRACRIKHRKVAAHCTIISTSPRYHKWYIHLLLKHSPCTKLCEKPNLQGCQCRICSRKAPNEQHVTCVSEEPLNQTKDPEECNPHSPPPSTTTYVPNKNTTGDDNPVTFEPPPKTHTEHPCPRLQQTQRAVVTEQHTNQLHGWAAVEKALTDFDKEEIVAYKEEIDSLLTFVSSFQRLISILT